MQDLDRAIAENKHLVWLEVSIEDIKVSSFKFNLVLLCGLFEGLIEG